MSAIDILIIAVVAVAAVIGFTRGIMSQIGSIAALIAGIIGARIFGDRVTLLFGDGSSPLDYAAGYGIAFLLVYVLVWLLARILRKTIHSFHLGIIDRLTGALFKVFLWSLILSLALNLWMLFQSDDTSLKQPGKPWRAAVVDLAPAVLGYMSRIVFNHDAPGDVISDIIHPSDER